MVLSYSLNGQQKEKIFKLSVMERNIGPLNWNILNKYEQYLNGNPIEASFTWLLLSSSIEI